MPPETESQTEQDEKTAEKSAGAKKEKTSADVVEKGTKTAREIKLEKEISEIQDKNASLETQVADLTKIVESAKNAPSPKGGGKSILDEINEFMGFGT